MPELRGPEAVLPAGAAIRYEDGALRLALSLDIYSVDAILRSCYWLTDRCFVHLAPANDRHIDVTLLGKSGDELETTHAAWQFINDLVDNQLRVSIQQETASVRQLIVAQAFSDVDVIDDHGRPVGPNGASCVNQSATTTWQPVR
jgi:His-Xaa-Ser system protein HxsD